jgi:60 kDa SS-A/Ro ribonucleoprotein
VSSKSDITRLDAACGVAILLRELCEEVEIMTFENKVESVPPRRGFALRDAIGRPRGGTMLGNAVQAANAKPYDRLVILTDEQSHDVVGNPKGKGYMINVAAHQNGVGYGPWTHIDGWSEAVIDYIIEAEKQ